MDFCNLRVGTRIRFIDENTVTHGLVIEWTFGHYLVEDEKSKAVVSCHKSKILSYGIFLELE